MRNVVAELEEIETGSQQGSNDSMYRAGAYSLLAALLRAEPDEALLQHAAGLADSRPEGILGGAMATLGKASESADAKQVREEYFALFIGIGRGELLPYGSWYQTGFLMERPLSDLRSDLARLGFERDASIREPEDHVAALCEVMSMLIEEESDIDLQRDFFSCHMAPWLPRFFADLKTAKASSYYKAVAGFGEAFTAFEKDFMEMQA